MTDEGWRGDHAAESAYLFRHALLRDAAYNLQPPLERARLHGIALHSILAMGEPATLDAWAGDLADHAKFAGEGADAVEKQGLGRTEVFWLDRAGAIAEQGLDTQKAQAVLERLALHPQATDTARADAWVRAGEQARLAGDRVRAREFLCKALEIDAPPEVRLRAQGSMGVLALQEHRLDEAEEALAGVLQAARQGGPTRVLVSTLHNLGLLCRERGRVDNARAYYDEALRRSRDEGDQRLEGSTLNNIGVMEMTAGNSTPAVSAFQDALRLHEQTGNVRSAVLTLLNLGEISRRAGRLAEARELVERALALSRKYGMRRNEGACLSNMARLHLDARDTTAAIETYQRAHDIHVETAHVTEQAEALNGLGQSHDVAGHAAESRKCFERALALAQAHGMEFQAAVAEFCLARDREDGPVLVVLEALLSRFRAIHHRRYECRVLVRIAILSARLRRAGTRPLVEQAIALCTELGLDHDLPRLQALLAFPVS